MIKHVKLEIVGVGDLGEDFIAKAREIEGPKIRNAGFKDGDKVVLVQERDFKRFIALESELVSLQDTHSILWNRYNELAQKSCL